MRAVLQNRHDRVVEILYGVCKAQGSYRIVYADHLKVPFKPIMITSATEGEGLQTHPFKPDVWAKRPNRLVDVFEVWDEQSDAGAVQNLLLSALTPKLATMTIICFDQISVDKARKLATLVLSSVFNKEGKMLLNPAEVSRRVILISEKIQNDDAAVKKFLEGKLRPLWAQSKSG